MIIVFTSRKSYKQKYQIKPYIQEKAEHFCMRIHKYTTKRLAYIGKISALLHVQGLYDCKNYFLALLYYLPILLKYC